MNFDFSDEQQALRAQLRKSFERELSLGEARSALEGRQPFSEAGWTLLAKLGVLGAAAPEGYGGLGLGRLELCVAAEEIGRQVLPVPFVSSIGLALEAIHRFGSPAQKERLVPALANGTVIGCAAFSELRDGRVDRAPETSFANLHLHGTKSPVADGGIAALAVVLAREGEDTSLVLVDLDADGVTRRSLTTVDPSRDHVELTFSDASAEHLGTPGNGVEKVEKLMNGAAVLTAFEQIGGADRALETAIEYAKTRHSFGRPIGSYQAIKHKLVEVYIKNQIARAHAYYGAWALAGDRPELSRAAAAARVAATDAFSYAAQETLQAHGGIGFTWEHDCQLFYRRARLLALEHGSRPRWQEALVSNLELDVT